MSGESEEMIGFGEIAGKIDKFDSGKRKFFETSEIFCDLGCLDNFGLKMNRVLAS